MVDEDGSSHIKKALEAEEEEEIKVGGVPARIVIGVAIGAGVTLAERIAGTITTMMIIPLALVSVGDQRKDLHNRPKTVLTVRGDRWRSHLIGVKPKR